MNVYGHPENAAAFEDYYANRHIPYASKHMPNVRGAENTRIVATPDGKAPPYYRVSQMTYDSLNDLRAGITSEDSRAMIADLANFATGGVTLLIGEGD